MKQYCSVCIRNCELGKSFCQRRDEKGKLKQNHSLCAIKIDYLFDKPIIYFRENVKVLSIGSWGCNFRCLGCQNVNLSWATTGKDLNSIETSPGEIVNLALKNSCAGICFTFNEPAILLETVQNIAAISREQGLFNVLVTNSTLTEKSVRKLSGVLDAVAADIKSLNNDFYYQYCGATGIDNVAGAILRCIKTFSESNCHVEVRTNIIPGANDNEENYRGIASWIRENLGYSTPWHITRFFPANRLLNIGQTPAESMLKAQKIGFDEGLKYVQLFTDKGCDCADETDLAEVNITSGVHNCCKDKG